MSSNTSSSSAVSKVSSSASLRGLTATNDGNKQQPVDEMKGWVQKWTNYLRGYQKRWMVLSQGALAYYRNQNEVGHSCRGVIIMTNASIHPYESCNFTVNSGSKSFHLKAANEAERQKWVTALELARVRAMKAADSDEEVDAMLEQNDGEAERTDLQNAMRALQAKVNDLNTYQDLISKHMSSMLRSLGELEENGTVEDRHAKIKVVNDRATIFRITTNAMVNACNEFVSMAQSHSKKWQRILQHEHQQRFQLQDQMEQLAKQHSALERAAMKDRINRDPENLTNRPPSAVYSDSDEDESLYQDAAESVTELNGSSSGSGKRATLGRTASQLSQLQDEDDEPGQQARAQASKLLQARIITSYSPDPDSKKLEVDHEASTPRRVSNTAKKRRKTIPPRSNAGMSLWSVMKNSIGKELSKIPMPVNFNEPLSMIQRLSEDFEYSNVLDKASGIEDSCEQMCYVAAFTVSAYAGLIHRTGKPFNPLLGETYECDRMDDYGWRSFAEQVSHHPPAAAQIVESLSGWKLYQEFTMTSKFRGKYLSVIPLGIAHLEFENTKNHYTWRKVTTTVHNIIVGKLWIDNHGEMTIENHTTGDKCHLKYVPYSYFSRDTPRRLTGVVTDKEGDVKWIVQGTWDDKVECARVLKEETNKGGSKPVFETTPPRVIWTKNPDLAGAEAFYHFTQLAIELNEPEPGVAPTDSRNRPDQRLMESGDWDKANTEKVRIEEKQRAARKQREAATEQAMLEGRPAKDYEPVWFSKQKDQYTGNFIYLYNGEYWKRKEEQKWDKCPDIY